MSGIKEGINFLQFTRNEVKLIGSYAYNKKEFKNSLSMISKNKLGSLSWTSFEKLKMDREFLKLLIKANQFYQKLF